MNDEVRKQRKEVLKRMEDNWNLELNTKNIQYFYKQNIDKFKKEESQKALAKISKYVEENLEKIKLEHKEINELLKNLGNICEHEILIPDSGYFYYQCPICMKHFDEDHIPETTQFIIGSANYEDIQKIKETLEEMITKDDFIEELDEYLSNLQAEKNIKIRRRYL